MEFCCREELEPCCGCICVSPSPKKGADEAAAIGLSEAKKNADRPPQLISNKLAASDPLAHLVDEQGGVTGSSQQLAPSVRRRLACSQVTDDQSESQQRGDMPAGGAVCIYLAGLRRLV